MFVVVASHEDLLIDKVWEASVLAIMDDTECDLTRPNTPPISVAFWKGNGTKAISGKSRLVKYYEPFGQIQSEDFPTCQPYFRSVCLEASQHR